MPIWLCAMSQRCRVGFGAGELAGHLHPCAKLRQRGRNLRRRCFVHDAARAILPAFGAMTGSLNVRDAAFDGLFDGPDYQAVMVGAARLAAIQPNRLLPDRARGRVNGSAHAPIGRSWKARQ